VSIEEIKRGWRRCRGAKSLIINPDAADKDRQIPTIPVLRTVTASAKSPDNAGLSAC